MGDMVGGDILRLIVASVYALFSIINFAKELDLVESTYPVGEIRHSRER